MSRTSARIPLQPSHPERVCWGCDKYCPADDLSCGNGTIRTMHPIELLGQKLKLSGAEMQAARERAATLIEDAWSQALAAPYPAASELTTDVYA